MILHIKDYDKVYEALKNAITNKKIFIYPTDTVYGIGGDARDKEVVERIYVAKKRPFEKKTSIILGSMEQVRRYTDVGEYETRMFAKYMPGPYTFIVKKNGKKIGIRIPEYTILRRISVELDVPIITTSANISGDKAKYKFEDIEKELIDAVDLAIDGGETLYKMSSTVVDLVDKRIIRRGAGKFEEKGFEL